MGISCSTSLKDLSRNEVLDKFVGEGVIADTDEYWDTLLTFSFKPPALPGDNRLLYEATCPIIEKLVTNSKKSHNVFSLVKVCMRKASKLRDESKCESNIATLQLRNSLFILRCVSHHVIQTRSEAELLLMFDPTPSAPAQDESSTSPLEFNSSESSNKVGVVSRSGLKILLHGIVMLLGEVPLVPFTYDVLTEAVNLSMTLMSGQLLTNDLYTNSVIINEMMSIPLDVSSALVQSLVHFFVSQPIPPPETLRVQPSGMLSSFTSGLLSLVLPQHDILENTSPLALSSLLFLLILVHQHSRGYNPYRESLSLICDENESKDKASFQLNFGHLHDAVCKQLTNEQTTLFFYQLLHSNLSFASFVYSRSDINTLLLPLLKQLSSEGNQPSHHSYMLLIILLILSQDECFNKSIHEITVKNITWAGDKTIPQTTLGSLMIIVLVRTVHRNIQHLRDKFLHTNCLATLANMSSHFHSLSLEASEKIVNLFRVLSKKYLKSKGEPIPVVSGAPPTTPTTPTSPATPTGQADTETLQEILLMLLEIINSSLTYTLHVNPHFVYSLLYQREIFTPYHGRPGFIDLVNNIEMVITFFANNVEKDGTPPYSAQFVTEIIKKYSKTWPRSRLRKFSELKFRYVEESQPDEFFVPYVWSLVQKHSCLYFDPKTHKHQQT